MRKILQWFYSSYDEKQMLLHLLKEKTSTLSVAELRVLNKVLQQYKFRNYENLKFEDLAAVATAFDTNIEDCCFSLYQLKKIIEFVN